MKVSRAVVEMKCLPIYKCSVCEVERGGTTARHSFDVESIEALVRAIESITPAPQAMPVGWSSYGHYVYKCAKCAT